MRMVIWLLVALALMGMAYLLIDANFSGGPIEIGRGFWGMYILPFAPFLLAAVLVLVGTVILFAAAFKRI